MGKATRSARFRPEVDARLVEEADRRGVAINVVINEAVETYLGFRTKVSQVEVPEKGPVSLIPDVLPGQGGVGLVEKAPETRALRCQCTNPDGQIYCLTCGKIR